MNDEDIIRLFESNDSFTRQAAQIFVTIISKAVQNNGEAFVALSGGSTPLPIFSHIKENYSRKISWEEVNFFWVDERMVPPTHEDSNFGNTNRQLLGSLPGVKTYRMKGERPPEKAADEYKTYLRKLVPFRNNLPCFDLIWLGMGTDGHTASIFPDSEVIHEKKEWVKEVWVDKLDTHRLTLTFPVINNARKRMIVIRGNQKLKIFNEIQNIEEKKYPIQHIEPSKAKNYWIIGKN